jgi:transcriptional regulator with XRE-family HTH domain
MTPSHLRMARAALKLTVRQLEVQTGVNKNVISRYESGREVLASAVQRLESLFREEGLTFIYENAARGPGVVLSKELSRRLERQPKTAATAKHPKLPKK